MPWNALLLSRIRSPVVITSEESSSPAAISRHDEHRPDDAAEAFKMVEDIKADSAQAGDPA